MVMLAPEAVEAAGSIGEAKGAKSASSAIGKHRSDSHKPRHAAPTPTDGSAGGTGKGKPKPAAGKASPSPKPKTEPTPPKSFWQNTADASNARAQQRLQTKLAYSATTPATPSLPGVGRYRNIMTAELLVGSVVIIGRNMDDIHKMLYEESAFLIVFLILSTLATGGPRLARVCAFFGGLIVLALLLHHSSTKPAGTVVSALFAGGNLGASEPATGNIGGAIGSAIGTQATPPGNSTSI